MKISPLMKLLGLAVLIGQCAGCCCHNKKGITVRGGFDFREYKKPSGFVEMVETGWDERRRLNDLRWLENANCDEELPAKGLTTSSELGDAKPQPDMDLPSLNEPPEFELPPAPQYVPPAPPVPAPEPDYTPSTENDSAQLPSTSEDEEDYQRMIELSAYEQPVRSVANRPFTSQQSPPQSTRFTSRGSWLWAKP